MTASARSSSRLVVALVVCAGCVHPNVESCANDKVCPSGSRCDDAHDGCAVQGQFDACSDPAKDHLACDVAGAHFGVCDQGVCERDHCGDGVQAIGEECDGGVPADVDCTHFGFYDKPGLACSATCALDTTACTGFCGDLVVDGGEACDGGPPVADCIADGFDTGAIACTGFCGPDVSACTSFAFVPSSAPSTAAMLRGAYAVGPNDVWVVGDGATIERCARTGCVAVAAPGTADLAAVWASGPSDAFAVGSGGTILHHDGMAWSTMASNVTNPLAGVFGLGPHDVWAVGGNATGSTGGIVLHYDGTSWSPVDVGSLGAFTGVWATSDQDVTIVGAGEIRHFDGTAWSKLNLSPSTGVQLTAVWGATPHDVFAVGDKARVYEFDPANASATITAQPAFAAVATTFTAITGFSRTDAYLTGDNHVFHFDGVSWRALGNVPDAIGGLAMATAGNGFVVGAHGSVAHYAGTGRSAPGTAGASNGLVAIWGTNAVVSGGPAPGLWAVGPTNSTGTTVGLRFYDGVTWSAPGLTVSGSEKNLHAIDGFADASKISAFAVGDGGYLIQLSGAGFTTSNSGGVTASLRGLWVASHLFAIAVGAPAVPSTSAVITKWNGTTWTKDVVAIVTTPLEAVWGTSPTQIYAVGDGGVIVAYNGTTWSAMTSGTTADLTAIAGTSATDIYATGTHGTLLHYDGVSWSPIAIPTTADLSAVRVDATELFVAGQTVLLHRVGATWLPIATAPLDAVRGMFLDGATLALVGPNETSVVLTRTVFHASPGELVCDDDWDDDGDGLIDCADPDCAASCP